MTIIKNPQKRVQPQLRENSLTQKTSEMFKNQFSERTKEFSANLANFADKSKLEKVFAPKTYKDTNKGVYFAALALSYVCNLISILTAFTFTFLFLFNSTKHLNINLAFTISLFVGVVSVFLLELIKRNSVRIAIKSMLMYRVARFDMVSVSVVTFVLSVSLSFFGAKMLPNTIAETPKFIDIDSLQSAYIERINKATELHTYKPTKTLTKTGAQLLQKLETERIEAIQSANDYNKGVQSDSTTQIVGLEYTFCTVSIVNEILLILCIFFILNYQFRCYLEILAHDTTQSEASESELQISHSVHPHFAPAQRPKKIGFSNLKTGQKVCDCCNNTYTSNHKKQRFCSNDCRYKYHRENKTN